MGCSLETKTMRILTVFFVLFSLHVSALRLIECSSDNGARIIYSTASFSGVAKLAVFTSDRRLSFAGSHQIFMLQRLGSSYLVDAADRLSGISYDNVQFTVLDRDFFETDVVIAKVNGCSRQETKLRMKCVSEKTVF